MIPVKKTHRNKKNRNLKDSCRNYLPSLNGANGSGCLIHNGSLHRVNTLMILDEFVSKPAKEFKAAHCSVVGMDHLLEKIGRY